MDERKLRTGLNVDEVREARAKYGTNALPAGHRAGFFRELAAAFGDPIIKILLLALGVNLIFALRTREWFEPVGIALAVFLATFISALSEYGSESAFRRLQAESAALRVRVRRSGAVQELSADELVMGDTVLLQAGDKVPADGALRAGGLSVDQSALNGESREAQKLPCGETRVWDLDSPGQLFRGTVVTAGEGVMEVLRLGAESFFGQSAGQLQQAPPPSPLRQRLGDLADKLARFGWAAALLVAAATLVQDLVLERPAVLTPAVLAPLLLHAALTALTVVVVAVPEGLPMMITVALSSNMVRMLRDRVLVRKLVGIETAGSMNILFTDKTGTLTTGQITAEGLLCGDGILRSPEQLAACPALAEWCALSGRCNTGAELSRDGVPLGGNSTDRALLALAAALPPVTAERRFYEPFTPDSKRSSCILTDGRGLVKGAWEQLLGTCRDCILPDGSRGSFDKAALTEAVKAQTAQGARAVALCAFDPRDAGYRTLIGVALLRDPLRPEAAPSVARLQRAGVQVVMLTGDAIDTAAALAGKCGILQQSGQVILTGAQLDELSDGELEALLPRLRVVCRALPAHKSRLVRAAQGLGLVCGMTGDGVNDAPALRAADVGFAMGSGTEVCKDAGDIILLDDNVSSIGAAVLYGRTIFRSIRRFLVFQLTLNLCAVGVSVAGPFIGVESPVTILQMLWLNIIMDTLAGLAFSGEPPRERYMERPPTDPKEPVLTRAMTAQIAGMGGYMLALCLVFLVFPPIRGLFRDEAAFLTGFFTLFVFAGLLGSLNARTDRRDLLAGLGQNPAFGLMALAGAVQLALVYYGGSLFRCVPLTGPELALTLALAATVLPADLLRKTLTRR